MPYWQEALMKGENIYRISATLQADIHLETESVEASFLRTSHIFQLCFITALQELKIHSTFYLLFKGKSIEDQRCFYSAGLHNQKPLIIIIIRLRNIYCFVICYLLICGELKAIHHIFTTLAILFKV